MDSQESVKILYICSKFDAFIKQPHIQLFLNGLIQNIIYYIFIT